MTTERPETVEWGLPHIVCRAGDCDNIVEAWLTTITSAALGGAPTS
jgi:hypothetical protein